MSVAGNTPHPIVEDAAIRAILEGTATATGQGFFNALVEQLAGVLGTRGAWVTEYLADQRRLRSLAFWLDGEWVEDYEYDLAGTPCEPVVESCALVHIPDRVVELYPRDPDLRRLHAVSYMGVPLLDTDGAVLGHLAVLDSSPMPKAPRCEALMHIFAARAAAEHQRTRAQNALHAREQQLSRLIRGALDAIVEADEALAVRLVNPAAEAMFGGPAGALLGRDLCDLFPKRAWEVIGQVLRHLGAPAGPCSRWIPSCLEARTLDGAVFPVEATVSRGRHGGRSSYTLILRNTSRREEAERTIQTLVSETEYLRGELAALRPDGAVLGCSRAIYDVLSEVRKVAPTEAAVLIHGETGTGKELIAHAIHAQSGRHAHPLVKVNCAAIPAALMESEFFGHERGAFTGATARREGRFAIADGGTIFLDEVGELPLELQPKLLRVVQEGEFEPVGSSDTRRVDVRIIAATNRDLKKEVREGRFREDLYYRLDVFPISLPPLRERGDDLLVLAQAFLDRFAQRSGRYFRRLDEAAAARLRAYDWPGNVRELQNVIERAVIVSEGERLQLERVLPLPADRAAGPVSAAAARILTASEMREFERLNLVRALEQTNWRVAGSEGAATLLGMNPSTLSSRIKALGIRRVDAR